MTSVAGAPGWWRWRLGLFNAAVTTGGIVLLPAAVVALALQRDWRQGLAERFGSVPATPVGRPAIWIHGASVGELTALAPVVHALRQDLPDHRLVLSSMTAGGRTAAAARVPDADARLLFPLDLPAVVARALDRVRPRLVLFSETELWPNFLAALAARRIPAIMVSGRISPSAFERYRRWRWLFAPALESVRWFCVQTVESARRLVALGAPPSRIVVTGSLKTALPLAAADTGMTLASLRVAASTDSVADVPSGVTTTPPIFVAASTHAGEDEPILDAFARMRTLVPDARLVLAPRKLDRVTDVAGLVAARGLTLVRRSTLAAGTDARWPANAAVLLLDTLGELAGLFRDARLAFVGGTLVPVGGHNVLEPAAVGTPIVVGPYTANVAADVERLVAVGGAVRTATVDELIAHAVELFADPARAAAAGARAAALVGGQQGPLAVTLAIVRGTLAAEDRRRGGAGA